MREVEARGIMEDLRAQKDKLLVKAAETLASFAATRQDEKAVRGLHTEAMAMVSMFSAEEQALILAMALEYFAKKQVPSSSSNKGSFQGGSKPASKKKNSGGSFTGGRGNGFYSPF